MLLWLYSYPGKGHSNHSSYLAVRKSAAPLNNEGWGGEVEMVSDSQHWEMSAAEFWRNREVKPFRGQSFLIGKDRTDTKTVKNNLEIRNWQTFTPQSSPDPGAGLGGVQSRFYFIGEIRPLRPLGGVGGGGGGEFLKYFVIVGTFHWVPLNVYFILHRVQW